MKEIICAQSLKSCLMIHAFSDKINIISVIGDQVRLADSLNRGTVSDVVAKQLRHLYEHKIVDGKMNVGLVPCVVSPPIKWG